MDNIGTGQSGRSLCINDMDLARVSDFPADDFRPGVMVMAALRVVWLPPEKVVSVIEEARERE